MRGGRGAIFAARNRFLAVSAPENPKDFSGDCQGVAVAGELAPPATLVTALAMSAIATANMLSVFPGLAHAAENRDNDADQYSADDYSAHFQPLTFCLFS